MGRVLHIGKLDFGNVVLPVFHSNPDDGQPPTFLGTGFFVEEKCHLATAHHILKGLGDEFHVVLPNEPDRRFRARLAKFDAETDLALLTVEGYRPERWMALGTDREIEQQRPVFSVDFGTTLVLGSQTQLSMATRVGNITRVFKHLDQYGKAGEMMLELSFPALRGASGAPVLSSKNGLVLGVVKGNVNYHLLPAQIEHVYDPEGQISEETQFILPQALAVNHRHLQELIGGA